MGDKENLPVLTDSSNSHSSGESVSAGTDSESESAGPWREAAEKGGSESFCELQPSSPLNSLVPPSGAKPKANNPSGNKPKATMKKSGKSSEQLREEGNTLFKKTNFTEAIVKYEEAVSVNPGDLNNSAKCYSNIAHCYNKINEFRKAISNSLAAMAAQPNFERGYTRCATAYMNIDRPVMAALVYFKGLAKCHTSSQSTNELSKALHELERTHQTAVEFAQLQLASSYDGNADKLNILSMEEAINSILGDSTIEIGLSDSSDQPPNMKEKGVPELALSSNSNSDSDNDIPTDVSSDHSQYDRKPFKIRNKKSKGKKKDQGQINFKFKILAEQEKLDKLREDDKKKEMKKKELGEKKKKTADQRERDKRELEVIRKKEEENLHRNKSKTVIEKNVKVQFDEICKDASTCFFNMVPKSSMERYSEALEMIKTYYADLWSTSQYKNISHNEEIVVIKYLYARACGETNNYDCIVDGLKKLDEIKEQHKAVKFPTVFFGYCNLWKKLNRYDKAAEAVREGIEFLDKGFNVTPYNWPGMPSQLIQETKKDGLLERLESLAVELKCPPKPDAVCKWKHCDQIQTLWHIVPSKDIYVSDPDYRGFYKVFCRDNCRLDYHKSCWMALKENVENKVVTKSPTEKDFFGRPCFTPDCNSMIVKIEIIEDNGTKTTLKDDKPMKKIDGENRKHKEEAHIKKGRKDELKQEQKLDKLKKKNREKLCTKISKENEGNSLNVKTGPAKTDEASSGEAVKPRTNSIITIQDDEFDETFSSGTYQKTNIEEKRVNLGLASSITESTGTQKLDELNLDRFTLKQENANLIVEMQEIKDKFYKFQSERKLEIKEINDKYMITAEENKNLMIENSFYKEQIGKMKKSVSEVSKITDELKKTKDSLNITITENNQLKSDLEETKNHLREESSLNFQLNSQLTLVSQENMTENQTNDLLRAKLLQNDFVKYKEVLEQKQANNRRTISHLGGSPELTLIPHVQLALSTLDEFNVRLVLASEKLDSQYETLVRQSQSNKDIKELHVDLAYLEPPNLGHSFINLLQSFIMSQSSALQPPLSFTIIPPPPISRLPPLFTGHSGSSSINPQGGILSHQEIVAPSSLMLPDGLTMHPPQLSGKHLLGHSMTGPPRILPILSQTPFFSTASSKQDPFQAATPIMSANTTSQNSTGARPKVSESGASSSISVSTTKAKQYEKLIAQLQKDHPNLSSEDAHNYIMELRQSNNGKLSGMNVQDIIKKVGCFIERDRGMSGGASPEDVSCSICFEDMYATDSRYLNPCSHRFHNYCINLWLKSPGGAGSTCPMCRNYIVMEDEYPGL